MKLTIRTNDGKVNHDKVYNNINEFFTNNGVEFSFFDENGKFTQITLTYNQQLWVSKE